VAGSTIRGRASWEDELRRAVRSAVDAANAVPVNVRRAEAAAVALDHRLQGATEAVGLGGPLGWRLVDIRAGLASHLDAVHVLRDSAYTGSGISRLLRRGIEQTTRQLAESVPGVVGASAASTRQGGGG
jgi:hypothetical protein